MKELINSHSMAAGIHARSQPHESHFLRVKGCIIAQIPLTNPQTMDVMLGSFNCLQIDPSLKQSILFDADLRAVETSSES